MDFFVDQLLRLADALRFSSPFHLIGLSMGGPIAATFASKFPERVKTLTLIDPSGAAPITLTPLLRLAKIPIVAETVFGLMGTENMVKAAARDFYDPKLVDHFISKYKVQMQYQGFQRALLSTLRNNMLASFVETYEAVGRLALPVLLFWGRNDVTVPFSQSEHVRNAIPNAHFHVIENCGHIPHYEKPDEVNPILLEFLRSK
jgi:pimeloyl-ACP methyl ester carboxylesterase